MDKEKYGEDLKALGVHLLQKGDKEGLKLYTTLLEDLDAHQDEMAKILNKEEVKIR